MQMVSPWARAVFLAAGLWVCACAVPGEALPHEKRTVEGSEWVVGFLNEPAFSGQMNGIDLRVKDGTGEPVTGLEETLEATVRYAVEERSHPVKLRRRYGQPGSYAGYFLPVRPGAYVFEISGRIGRTEVREVFESGPGRFSGVEDTEPLKI